MLWQTWKGRICKTSLGICRASLERATAAGPCSGFWKVLGTACHQPVPSDWFCPCSEGRPLALGSSWGRLCRISVALC